MQALDGIKVLDLSALGPGPFATMVLADFGADVIMVDRPDAPEDDRPLFSRGKRSIRLDLKSEVGREELWRLVDEADVLVEGFRPGVMERLGLGPDVVLDRKPSIIYTRVTGWGQDGPYAVRAGHDINYIAIAGVLGLIGIDDEPTPPLSIVGDFAGGSLTAVIGILMALRVRDHTGKGQVIDAAMIDGSALLITTQLEMQAKGQWGPRGTNLVEGRAPFYGSYRCADDRWFSVGAMEPKFYRAFLEVLGLNDEPIEEQLDIARWPRQRSRIAAVFATRSRADWTELFAEVDTCAAPVLELDELADDPHLSHRHVVLPIAGGGWQAAPAPRLSLTPGRAGERPRVGQHTTEVAGTRGTGFGPRSATAT